MPTWLQTGSQGRGVCSQCPSCSFCREDPFWNPRCPHLCVGSLSALPYTCLNSPNSELSQLSPSPDTPPPRFACGGGVHTEAPGVWQAQHAGLFRQQPLSTDLDRELAASLGPCGGSQPHVRLSRRWADLPGFLLFKLHTGTL